MRQKTELTYHPAVEVLHASGLGDVAGDSKVEEDVVHVGVFVWFETTQDDKASALVDCLGHLDKPAAQGREWECGLVDIVWAKAARKS